MKNTRIRANHALHLCSFNKTQMYLISFAYTHLIIFAYNMNSILCRLKYYFTRNKNQFAYFLKRMLKAHFLLLEGMMVKDTCVLIHDPNMKLIN